MRKTDFTKALTEYFLNLSAYYMRGESQYHQFIQRYFQATPSIFSRKERHLRKLYRIALSEYGTCF